jgi:hypothetical protein
MPKALGDCASPDATNTTTLIAARSHAARVRAIRPIRTNDPCDANCFDVIDLSSRAHGPRGFMI